MRKLLFAFIQLLFLSTFAQQAVEELNDKIPVEKTYKALMYDNSVNFYTVVEEAEKYFESIDRFAKGSGWKGFQRWKSLNEYKYYPSGDRSQVDPNFVGKQFQLFKKQNATNKSLFSTAWKDLGPYTIDSITRHYSAGLGRIEDFYVDPIDSNLIYLGSRSGGFWKSVNGGVSWSGGSTDTLVASGVDIIAVSPTNPDSILINVSNSQNDYSHGIYRSIDGGLSWTESNFNPVKVGKGGLGSNFRIYSIKYHPTIRDLIFIGTNSGLYRSKDNLKTWSRIERGLDISQITVHPTDDSIIYLYDLSYWNTQHDVIYRSLDTGKTFDPSNTIEKSNVRRVVRLSVSNNCSDCLYYASSNGVWKSTDKGNTFSFLSNPDETCEAFAVSDVDTSNMIYGYLDLESSTNGGKTFTQTTEWSLGNTNAAGNGFNESYTKSSDYIHADMRNAQYIDDKFYVATDGFLCKSNDNGENWKIISEGIGIRENYKLGVSQSNHYRTIAGSQDNGSSFLTEKGWVEAYGADGMEAIIHPLNDDYVIFSSQFGGRRRSTNGTLTNDGRSPSGSTPGYWIAPLAYDPNDHFVVYDFREFVYRSLDFGESYTNIGQPSFTGDIMRAAIAENNSDIMIVSRFESIEKSIDGGITFTDIGNGLPNSEIQDIAFDPNNDSLIVVVYGNYENDKNKIYITSDQGNTWRNVTHNLGSMPIRSVVIDHSDSSYIYVGAEIGVYVKSINGTQWELYNNQLPNMSVRELEVVFGSNTLRAATWGRGLWEYSLKGRENFPAIIKTFINQTPTFETPKQSIDQFVNATISFNGSPTSVFLNWSIDSITLDSSIAMTNVYDSTWQSIKALPNGEVGDKIYFKVFAVGNNNDTSETYRFMYEVKVGGYCSATGNNGFGNLYLQNVTLENINNTTVNASYSLYKTPVAEVYVDSTYNLYVEANVSWSLNDFAAWIDYNQDEVFDASEQIINDQDAGGDTDIDFKVPKLAREGDTVRLRIRLSYFGEAQNCGDQYGEVEDYLLVIKKNPELIFSLNSDTICPETKLQFEYPGDKVDSLVWTFSKGSITISSEKIRDSVMFTEVGSYKLNFKVYFEGRLFELDSLDAIYVADTFDLGITQSGVVLNADQSGTSYQWINCTNGNVAVSGANSQSFIPTSNGDYAVELTIADCRDTSECINYNLVGINEVKTETEFKIHPNPASRSITVELNLDSKGQLFRIFDVAGNLVLEQQIENSKQLIEVEELAKGLYFVNFKDDFRKLMIIR